MRVHVKSNRPKQLSGLLIVLLMVLSFGLSAVDSPTPPEVTDAAKIGLSVLAPRVTDSANVELGFGFPVYTIEPGRLLDKTPQPLWEKVTGTDVWRFIVNADGQAAALLTVAKVDGSWQTVGIGAMVLAKEVDTVCNAFPKAEGYNYRFIRVFQAKADFMEVKKGNDQPGYAPMISARVSLQIENVHKGPSHTLFQSEIIEPLRDVVAHSLERDKRVDSQLRTEK